MSKKQDEIGVEFTCQDCGGESNSAGMPEDCRDKPGLRMYFKYCKPCRRKRIEKALNILPQVVGALATDYDQKNPG